MEESSEAIRVSIFIVIQFVSKQIKEEDDL